jgi:glycerol-3-phosphate dehydrogenase
VPEGRETARAALTARTFDLLVIGGGIVGAGVAAEAAHAGLSVALVEREDFGAGTSGASSKLVHGGLRYLRLGDVRLVGEAHAERLRLERTVAPHLVRPLPFVLPIYRGGPYRPAEIRVGLALYASLSAFRDGRPSVVAAEEGRRLVPRLRLEGLRACGVYVDSQTNDTRLCLANVAAAAEAGAVVLNHAEVVALAVVDGRVAGAELRDRLDGASLGVSARAVVNATGPWVDAVRRLESSRAGTSVRLSKGAHVLLALDEPWRAAVTVPVDRTRVSFAVPWEGMLLLGTTDEPYDGTPDDLEVGDGDVAQILREAGSALDLPMGDLLSTLVGLRVLPAGRGGTAAARRETLVSRGPRGLVTVAGGKLTTYRRIALDVLRELGVRRAVRNPRPLPGAADAEAVEALLPHEDAEVRAHLAHLYGSHAPIVLDGDPALHERIHPDGPDVLAQVVHAREREWAVTVDDVLRRRTTVAVRGLATADVRERVAALL